MRSTLFAHCSQIKISISAVRATCSGTGTPIRKTNAW